MSSRNAFLDAPSRAVAGKLNGVLFGLADELAKGAPWREAEARGAKALLEAGFAQVDYVSVRDAEALGVFAGDRIDRDARVLAAARIGGVRLIDNVAAPL
jgi:pantoate--beta-alanine ligase